MKRLLYSLSVFSLFSLSVNASPLIDEEFYVLGSVDEIQDLITSGSVIVDHVDEEGFELYGPQGISEYLEKRGMLYYQVLENKNANEYASFEELTDKLQELARLRPDIFKLFSIGKSVQGRDLWVMKISDNVEVDEVEPEFKYISSMHGDEIVGRELSVRLIEKIAQEYDSNSLIQDLVNNTEIFIMPSMNPDGTQLRRRANANRVDLNRNFPDIIRDRESRLPGREAETQHVMNFQESRNFSFSANFHGGTMVVNYPWDSTFTPHPFNDLLVDLSLSYSKLCSPMYQSRQFKQGITNGASWYLVRGGMQDWSSFWYDDLQLTIEVSHVKWPSYSQIEGLWREQEMSLVNLMTKVHQGLGVKFSDSQSGQIAIQMISPENKDMGTYTYKRGEFYKVLPQGKYLLRVEGKEAIEAEVSGNILSNGNYYSL